MAAQQQQQQAQQAGLAQLALPMGDGNFSNLDQDLAALLTKNQVHPTVHQQLQQLGCTSVAIFANWLEDRNGVKAAFLAATDLRDDKGQEARLKQAWREADIITTEGLTRAGQSMAMQEVDAPLDDTLQKGLESNFRTAYGWAKIDNRRTGCDSLLGRVSREFQRRQPSMFAVSRVKCLARAQKSSNAKRQRVADGLNLEWFGELNDVTDDTDTLAKWLRNLDVLANTWALAGCFDVPWLGSRIRYAHWEATQAYVFELRVRLEPLCQLYWPQGVLDYAIRIEEEFRAAALQLARDDPPTPWGVALAVVLREKNGVWDNCKDTLGPKIPRQGDAQPDASSSWDFPPSPLFTDKGKGKGKAKPKVLKTIKGNGKGGKGNGKGKVEDPRRYWQTQNTSANGRWLCKKYNDPRGCKAPCPEGGHHACDVTLTSGYGCDQTGHCRQNHSIQHHGAPKTK